MTKGQIESKLSEAISKFEVEQMGRGPKQIKTIIVQDMIIVRIHGFFSVGEKTLSDKKEGLELIKRLRTALFESSKDLLEEQIKEIIQMPIVDMYSDVSIESGEKIIIIIVNENLEKWIQEN